MKLTHLINVKVSGGPGGGTKTILKGGECRIRNSKLSRFLGNRVGVLVLVPDGGSISRVEVKEVAHEAL